MRDDTNNEYENRKQTHKDTGSKTVEDPISLPSVRSLIIIPATYLTLMGVIQYKRKEEAGLTLSVGFRSSSRFTQNLVGFEFFVSWLVICPPAPERLSAQHDRLMNVRRPELRGRFGRNPDFHTFFSVPESRIVGVQRDMVGYLSHWSNIVALITDKLVTEDCDGIVNHQSSIVDLRFTRSFLILKNFSQYSQRVKKIVILTHITGRHPVKILIRISVTNLQALSIPKRSS